MGRLSQAEAVNEEGYQLNEWLLARDPNREDHHQRRSDSYWLRGLVSEGRAADSADPAGHWRTAKSWYATSLQNMRAQFEAGTLPAHRKTWIEERSGDIARCDSALTALENTP
jgi:hypothetical protein